MTEPQTSYTVSSKNPDTMLANLLASLCSVRKQKSALEKSEKSLVAQIRPLVDPGLDKLALEEKDTTMTVGSYRLMRSEGVTRTIAGDLLLAKGIPQTVITDCTKATPYFKYSVREIPQVPTK